MKGTVKINAWAMFFCNSCPEIYTNRTDKTVNWYHDCELTHAWPKHIRERHHEFLKAFPEWAQELQKTFKQEVKPGFKPTKITRLPWKDPVATEHGEKDFQVIKPKELDTGKAQNKPSKAQNMAEDDFEELKGSTFGHLEYAGVPYDNDLMAQDKDDADGNVAPKGYENEIDEAWISDWKKKAGAGCECGSEATFGPGGAHSEWCKLYKGGK